MYGMLSGLITNKNTIDMIFDYLDKNNLTMIINYTTGESECYSKDKQRLLDLKPLAKETFKYYFKEDSMKLKEGFCCFHFEEAYIHGIYPVLKVPDARNYPAKKEICCFCGKDPKKYTRI